MLGHSNTFVKAFLTVSYKNNLSPNKKTLQFFLFLTCTHKHLGTTLCTAKVGECDLVFLFPKNRTTWLWLIDCYNIECLLI